MSCVGIPKPLEVENLNIISNIISAYELETTDLSSRYGWRKTIRVIAGQNYIYHRNSDKLMGFCFANIRYDYPPYYIGENLDNFELYDYLKKSLNDKFGEGFDFDNRKPIIDEMQEHFEIISELYNLQYIEEISLTHWIVNEDKMFLLLFIR
jgi:hypothetical protein